MPSTCWPSDGEAAGASGGACGIGTPSGPIEPGGPGARRCPSVESGASGREAPAFAATRAKRRAMRTALRAAMARVYALPRRLPGGGLFAQQPLPQAGELADEPVARRGDREQRSERDHRVDRLAALRRPVVVLEVEPERELVERQRRAGAVDERRRPRRELAPAPDADLVQPRVP